MKIKIETTNDIISALEVKEHNNNIYNQIEDIRVKSNKGIISADQFLNEFFELKKELI